MDMGQHLADILEISNRLSDIGHPVNQELLCSALLGSLPPEYGPLITSIEGRNDEFITSKYVREKILEEAARLNEPPPESPLYTRALNTQRTTSTGRPNPQKTCFYCGKTGHIRRDCRYLNQHTSHLGLKSTSKGWTTKARPIQPPETHSKMVNIQSDDILGERRSTKNPPIMKEHITTSLTELRVMSQHSPVVNVYQPTWLIDSGACMHMTRDRTLLEDYQELSSPLTVTSAGGHPSTVIGKGKRTLVLRDTHDKEHSLTLTDIYLVPSLTDNLLAISALEDAGYDVIFQQGKVTLESNDKTLILAHREQGLYLHHEESIKKDIQAKVCEHIWHRRLGHRHYEGIHKLAKQEGGAHIHIDPCQGDTFCDICQTTKMKNKPYPSKNRPSTNHVFDLLHADLCGPINPTSAGGNHYLLTIIDDYSRYLTTYPIRTKSEAAYKIMEFLEHGKNRHGHRPTRFRTDGGGEFSSRELNNFLKNKGIIHQVTIPYSPQSNGVAERFNHTLLDMTRALLKQSGLSTDMWAEMASTATYLININIPRNMRKSPYQLWNGHEPHYEYVRSIGSQCFYWNNSPSRNKLEDRALQGILVGYGTIAGTYRIWSPELGKITISRKVTFAPDICSTKKTNPEHYRQAELELTTTEPPESEDKQGEGTTLEDPDEPGIQPLRRSTRTTRGTNTDKLTYDTLGSPSSSTSDWYVNHPLKTLGND